MMLTNGIHSFVSLAFVHLQRIHIVVIVVMLLFESSLALVFLSELVSLSEGIFFSANRDCVLLSQLNSTITLPRICAHTHTQFFSSFWLP